MTKEELYQRIVSILNETFDIAPEKITPQAELNADLDIDSIDAVDLMVQMKQLTGKRLQPETFKSVRTVQDVVDALHAAVQG
ncbi:acyl carrier protein [Uliginosibacterium sp. sgz301328]|uniref:acyl carrier protein n=1 Tax=Uliginosibacterium sp. sgz301328 TaxID=3243764 RepID=UPI00359DD34A